MKVALGDIAVFFSWALLGCIRGLSFSVLLTALISLRDGVRGAFRILFDSKLLFFLAGEGMEAMSTSRLELWCRKELVPRMISELVQSRKGFSSQFS